MTCVKNNASGTGINRAGGPHANGAPTRPAASNRTVRTPGSRGEADSVATGRASVSTASVSTASVPTASVSTASANAPAATATVTAGRAPVRTAKSGTGTGAVPRGRTHAGTYVADTYDGDMTATSGGTPTLAHDGEPAGLARVTLAMQPTEEQVAPAPGRLVGLCSWAAAVGILGAIIAVWAGIVQLTGPPAWFLPTAAVLGIAGVGLTVAAFFTARQRIIPWALLGLATCTLGAAIFVIITAATPVAIA